MSKAAVFTMKLEPDLRAEFMAAAEESHRPASQVVRELMREFVQRQQDRRDHSVFLHDKVHAARAAVANGLGRSDAAVEAEFAARRARITDRTLTGTGVKVMWTPEAERDRAAIWDYLAARDPDAALRIDRLFSAAAAGLADFPLLGHEGEVPGTRELTPHRRYRLVYEVVHDTVWILVLIHTARQWPALRLS